MAEYLSCAETAKLIRAALKKSFPGVKFSVRSSVYSGGASIDVGWTDGPAEKAVKAVAGGYCSGGFDGMIDMAYSTDEWLMPDGSVCAASSPGTSGSMGVYSPYDEPAPSPEAKRVRFGADYVFCNKKWSVPAYTAVVNKVCAEYGVEVPEIKVSGDEAFVGWDIKVPNAGDYLANLIGRELKKEDYA